MRKSYTPRGTSSGSELFSASRSTQRGRVGRGDFAPGYDDRRNPISCRPSNSSFNFSHSASTVRERYEALDADSNSIDEYLSVSGSSTTHARELLSKIRSSDHGRGSTIGSRAWDQEVSLADRGTARGVYSEPKPLRSLPRNISVPSPRRRLDFCQDDEEMCENHGMNSMNVSAPSPSRHELLVMQDVLKKKDSEAADLRRELSAKDNEMDDLRREMEKLKVEHEENISSARSELLVSFKKDMKEMKTEWERACQRVKDESDSTQRALETELDHAIQCKNSLEREMKRVKAECSIQMEEEHARYKKTMEDLKRSNEEDLERLRDMFEKLSESTKRSTAKIESELKEEIHALLEENERVKMSYEESRSELQICKADLQEVNANYKKSLDENLLLQKESTISMNKLEEASAERDTAARFCENLECELTNAKKDFQRVDSEYQLCQEERTFFKKELEEAVKSRDEIKSEYDQVAKKLVDVQEELRLSQRTKESTEHEMAIMKERMKRSLDRAIDEKDRTQKRYNELEKEQEGASVKKRAETSKYLEEIEQLKSANKQLMRERDELKEELIDVLEAASAYQS